MLYFDNAATSWPKAPGVSDAMKYYIDNIGVNINRGVYAPAQEAGLTALTLREQLAAFLYRYAKLCGYDCQPDGNLSAYKDRNQISSYARDAISWAVGAGIINGTSATTLEPRSNATRAEIAAMLCRLLNFVEQSDPMS